MLCHIFTLLRDQCVEGAVKDGCSFGEFRRQGSVINFTVIDFGEADIRFRHLPAFVCQDALRRAILIGDNQLS